MSEVCYLALPRIPVLTDLSLPCALYRLNKLLLTEQMRQGVAQEKGQAWDALF